MAGTYEVDTHDQRLTHIENMADAEITKSDASYDSRISGTDTYFDNQINTVKDYEQRQTDIQNEQTDFAIEQINQQKDQAKKDYTKEQSGAYTDWQKQSNQYGVNAEQRAASGLTNSGYSESSQVSMYNTYQNRVATARESYNRAVLNYDNAIKDARLKNSAALAEIAYNSLKKQLELSLQGFQYKNQLLTEKANARRAISDSYWTRYQNMYSNIMEENKLKESARQYNESRAETKRHNQATEAATRAAQDLERAKFEWQKSQAESSGSSGGGSGGGSGGKGTIIKGGNSGGTIKPTGQSGGTSGNTSSIGGGSGVKGPGKLVVSKESILDLGLGPISEKTLNGLVASGQVKEVVKNGKITFKRVFKK